MTQPSNKKNAPEVLQDSEGNIRNTQPLDKEQLMKDNTILPADERILLRDENLQPPEWADDATAEVTDLGAMFMFSKEFGKAEYAELDGYPYEAAHSATVSLEQPMQIVPPIIEIQPAMVLLATGDGLIRMTPDQAEYLGNMLEDAARKLWQADGPTAPNGVK